MNIREPTKTKLCIWRIKLERNPSKKLQRWAKIESRQKKEQQKKTSTALYAKFAQFLPSFIIFLLVFFSHSLVVYSSHGTVSQFWQAKSYLKMSANSVKKNVLKTTTRRKSKKCTRFFSPCFIATYSLFLLYYFQPYEHTINYFF